jgi:hypothetical protein
MTFPAGSRNQARKSRQTCQDHKKDDALLLWPMLHNVTPACLPKSARLQHLSICRAYTCGLRAIDAWNGRALVQAFFVGAGVTRPVQLPWCNMWLLPRVAPPKPLGHVSALQGLPPTERCDGKSANASCCAHARWRVSAVVAHVHSRLRAAALQQSARVMPSNFERSGERMAPSFKLEIVSPVTRKLHAIHTSRITPVARQ